MITASKKSLIIVDSRVNDWQSLLADVDSNTPVLVLDASRDGLAQIAEQIALYQNLDAIHIISHGNTGSLLLGSTTLNSNNLGDYRTPLNMLGNALSENGDLLLYGCNVAQGDDGLAFINQLSTITGADVAASDDLTGNAALGGDWELEQSTGIIESAEIQPVNYNGLLPTRDYGYYNLNDAVQIFSSSIIGAGADAFTDSFKNFLQTGIDEAKVQGNLVKKILIVAKNLGAEFIGGAVLESLDVIFTGSNFSIGDVTIGIAGGLVTAGAVFLVMPEILAAFGVATTTVSVLALVGVVEGVAGSLLWSCISDLLGIDYEEIFKGDVDLQFSDTSGKQISGFYYPKGLPIVIDEYGNADQYVNAIRQFISYAGNEIVNGGSIEFSELGFNTKYTLYNGNFIDGLVQLSSATTIPEFLKKGVVNPNSSAYESGYPNKYFFFKEGQEALDIPVMINGTEQIITVNNIYNEQVSANNLLLGKGDEKNLVMGLASVQELKGGNNSDLILSGNLDDTINGGGGDDTLLGGGGNDVFLASSGDDVIDGGLDIDTLVFSTKRNVDVDLNKHTAVTHNLLFNDNYTLYNIENITTDDGDDTILGNDADNIIKTGGGKNYIAGGNGYDTYIVDGVDTINDSDGKGRVIVAGITLSGGNSVDGILWKDSNGFTYKPIGNSLLITPSGNNGNKVIIENFHSGDLGIVLTPSELPEDSANRFNPEYPAKKYKPSSELSPDIAGRFNAATSAVLRKDPLTLDLDGDGLETTGISATNPILFDHDADGVKTATGWVIADDGFLVWDRNNNGNIDNGRELFGDATLKSNGQLAKDGFDALADLDSNADGKIDASDANFSQLRVWRDLNQDGITQNGELFTLADVGIAAIQLAKTANSVILPNGNQIADLGSFVRLDGSAGTVGEAGNLGDINLISDTFHSQFTDVIALTDIAKALPDIQGAGLVRNLHEAMSLGNTQASTLVTLLANYLNASDRSARLTQLDGLIKAWSDTSTMKTTATGAYGNHPLTLTFAGVATGSAAYNDWLSKLTILEHFNGRTFLPVPSDTTSAVAINFFTDRLNLLNQSYQALKDSVYQSLALQTHLKPYLDAISLTVDATGIKLDFTALNALLETHKQSNGVNALSDLLELEKYMGIPFAENGWNGLDIVMNWLSDSASTQIDINTPLIQLGYRTATTGDDLLIGGIGGDNIHGSAGNDTLFGLQGNDILNGEAGDDSLVGGLGNDALYGDNGNDTLVGGKGDDSLNGGLGNDTYQFNLGDGQDFIQDIDYTVGNSDTLLLNVNSTSVTTQRDGNTLVLSINGTTDKVSLYAYLFDAAYQIENIRFADGVVWTANDIILNTLGTDNSETIYGYINNDTLFGNGGNDTLYGQAGNDLLNGGAADDILNGESGNDTLIGGKGNDSLYGGIGNDVYQFSLGDGQDYIQDGDNTAGNSDTLQFMDINSTAVTAQRDGISLVLSVNGTTDSVSIYSYFSSSTYLFENIVFADGVVWTPSNLVINATGNDNSETIVGYINNDTLLGNAGADTLYGREGDDSLNGGTADDILNGESGNDTLIGGKGNDSLYGGLGNDIYQFSLGDGQDVIQDGDNTAGNSDTLQFIAINSTAVTAQRNGISLVLSVNGTTDSVSIYSYFSSTTYLIENIVFADGVIWTPNNIVINTIGNDNTETLVGYINNDTLLGNAGNDTLYGREGDDSLNGGTADDILNGESGNDTLIGGKGNDSLYGGLGNDIYQFSLGDGQDVIQDGDNTAGNSDTLQFMDINSTAVTAQRNGSTLILSVNGTTDSVSIDSYFNSTTYQIEKIAFADGVIWTPSIVTNLATNIATNNNAPVSGSNANDVLQGNNGNDSLSGLAGNDTLIGGKGNDSLYGGLGNDLYQFSLGDGQDYIQDVDSTVGNSDTLQFMDINSTAVTAQYANGSLVLSVPGTTDSIRIYTYFGGFTYQIENIVFADGVVWTANNLIIKDTGTENGETIYGYINNDTLLGNGGNDTLYGQSGDDSLNGGTADDTLYGEKGNDTLIGGKGNDTLYGDLGNDIYQFSLGDGQDVIQDSDSDNTVGNNDTLQLLNINSTQVTAQYSNIYGSLILSIQGSTDSITIQYYFSNYQIENIVFADGVIWTPGNIVINNTGTENSETIYGYINNDTLLGNGGNDTLYGREGNDSLNGGAADDILYGEKGNDTLIGGKGNDSLYGDLGNDLYQFSLGDGQDVIQDRDNTVGNNDTLQLLNINSTQVTAQRINDSLILSIQGTNDSITMQSYFGNFLNTDFKIENIVFADGMVWTPTNIVINTTGNDNSETIYGYINNDTLFGNGGNDTLYGREGNDSLNGGAADDILYGEKGNDTLIGGKGNDSLYGDLGNDIYQFSLGDGQDVIQDVDSTVGNSDTLQLLDINSTAVTAQNVNSSLVLSVQGANDSITIRDYFYSTTYQVEKIVFADGVIWTPGNIVMSTIKASISAGITAIEGGATGTFNITLDKPAPIGGLLVNYNLVGSTATLTTDYTLGTGNNINTVTSNSFTIAEGATGATLNVKAAADSIIDPDETVKLTLLPAAGYQLVSNTATLIIAENKAPSNIVISPNSINENVATGSVVGTLSSIDPDAGNTFTYSLVAGGVDNSAFTVVGDQLKINLSPNYEAKSSYSIKVRTTDQGGLFFDKALTIGINNLVEAPVLTTPATISYTDTVSVDTFAIKTGTLVASVDFSLTKTYNIAGTLGVDVTDNLNGTISKSNAYGTLTVNKTSGVYSFAPNNTAIEPLTADVTDNTLTVTVSDGSSTDSKAFTVTITQSGITESNGDDNLVGTLGNDNINGLAGNDIIDGKAGSDFIKGGLGDDILDGGVSDVYNPGVVDSLFGEDGNDTFLVRGFFNAGNYNGGTGTDTLDFSQADSYTAGRRASEGAGSYVDLTAGKAYSYYLASNGFLWTDAVGIINVNSIENVIGTDQGDKLVGDANANTLTGGAGRDILDGAGGIDSMAGGTGNDTYYVDNVGDVVTENSGEGTDGVWSALSAYTLADNVESLGLLAGAVSGTGNAGNNYILGNNADNSLDGGIGIDTLVGGLGNDRYYVDAATDVVVENAGGGWDYVYSTATSYTLSANIEALLLTGAAVNGFGNADANVLVGNTLDNSLDGGAGSDIIFGGSGADTLDGGVSDVYNPGVTDTLNGEAGNDTFLVRGFYGAGNYDGGANTDTLDFSQSDAYTTGRRSAEGAGVSVNLATHIANTYYRVADNFTWANVNGQITVNNIEQLIGTDQGDKLVGDANANTLTGGAGRDILDGAGGIDSMAGGTGNDAYYVDNVSDVVTENTDEGTDGVWSALSAYTLADNVESLGLLAGAVSGTGNAGNNYILGNNADNSLDGGIGIDTLVGGLGNDRYYVDAATDVVVENAGGGWDYVYSTATSYTLSANIEALLLTGAAVNGFGNADANVLVGNTLDNSLDGGAGSDIIFGGSGADTLDGGVSDVYNPGVTDTLNGEAGNDTFLVRGFYGAGNYDGGADTDTLDFSQSDAYTAGRRSAEGAGVSVDLAANKASTYYRVADNFTWTDANGQLMLVSIENVKGTAQGDVLYGDVNANILEAGNGNDLLAGGVGKDSYLLQETIAATDTVKITAGDSLIGNHDVVNSFGLGTGTINTTGVDRLDLASTSIAANVSNIDGTDVGTVASHTIQNGMMTFASLTGDPLAITAANLNDAIHYVQTAITANNTVAFVSEGNTFVFQDGGITDTLVELIGVTADSVNNSGLAAGAVWIV
jgi:Ca2+-binding RTX toxin-like protein